MRGFDHATILSPSFYGLRKERREQGPAFCVLNYDQKFRGGSSRKIGRWCAARFLKPLPYFRPKCSKLIPSFIPKRLKKKQTLWRGTYLYSLYKGLSPRGEKLFADYEQARLINRQGRSSGLIPCTERRLNRFKRRCLK